MLRQMTGQEQLWTQLEAFARQVHGSLKPKEVAYEVANNGRRLIECDRVSVGVRYGGTSASRPSAAPTWWKALQRRPPHAQAVPERPELGREAGLQRRRATTVCRRASFTPSTTTTTCGMAGRPHASSSDRLAASSAGRSPPAVSPWPPGDRLRALRAAKAADHRVALGSRDRTGRRGRRRAHWPCRRARESRRASVRARAHRGGPGCSWSRRRGSCRFRRRRQRRVGEAAM